MSLIHRYQSNGYNIVLDINSGCIHLVDEVTYEVLPYLEEGMDTAEMKKMWKLLFLNAESLQKRECFSQKIFTRQQSKNLQTADRQ